MYDVIIIGKGPAGISASLYIKRANLKVVVIGKDEGALKKAQKVENYYGIIESGEKILETGVNLLIPLYMVKVYLLLLLILQFLLHIHYYLLLL